MKRFLFIISSLLVLCSFTVQQVPNPKNAISDGFVSNPDGVLSSSGVTAINDICRAARKDCEVEIAVVALKSIGLEDAFSFAHKLFNYWGVGNSKNQGVLMLLVVGDREIQIVTGGGMEGILPDAACESILEDHMYGPLGNEKWDEGMLAGVKAIYDKCSSPQAKAELLLDGYKVRESDDFLYYYIMVSMLVAILMLGLAYVESNWSIYSSNNVRYAHMASAEGILWIVGVFFLPSIWVAVYFHFYRRSVRRKQIYCPHCKAKMKLLSEKEEDAYLSADKQAEETVGSMDYDVWHCPDCSYNIILDYKKMTTKYSACPSCNAKTYYMLSDVVLRQPTTLHKGAGEKTYVCKHCQYKSVRPYTIPIIILSGGSGRGGHGGGFGGGGGFSGGSWGGGMSFGGGAGGRF